MSKREMRCPHKDKVSDCIECMAVLNSMTLQSNQDKDELDDLRDHLERAYQGALDSNPHSFSGAAKVAFADYVMARFLSWHKKESRAHNSKLIQAVLGEVESLGPRDRKPDYSKHYATSNGGLTNVTTENLQDEGFNESSKVWRTVLSRLKKKYGGAGE